MIKQEFLAMSLPYGLKVQFTDSNERGYSKEVIGTIGCVYDDGVITCFDTVNAAPDEFRMILHPLSDITKEITHNGVPFVPIVELLENSSFDTSKMSEEEIMSFGEVYSRIDLITLNDLPLYLQWHFDLFGGIESGEAINVNTLEINPYK